MVNGSGNMSTMVNGSGNGMPPMTMRMVTAATPANISINGIVITATTSGSAGNVPVRFVEGTSNSANFASNTLTVTVTNMSTLEQIVTAINAVAEFNASLATVGTGANVIAPAVNTSARLTGGVDGVNAIAGTRGMITINTGTDPTRAMSFRAVNTGATGIILDLSPDSTISTQVAISVTGTRITVRWRSASSNDIAAAINGNTDANALVMATGTHSGRAPNVLGVHNLPAGTDAVPAITAVPSTATVNGITFNASMVGTGGNMIDVRFVQNTSQTTPVTASHASNVITITYNNPTTITKQQVVTAVNALTSPNNVVTASVTTAGRLGRVVSGMLSGGADSR